MSLSPTAAPTDECLTSLLNWAKRQGYFFLRFTHPDPGYLDRITALSLSERREPFPFYRDLGEELIVELTTDHNRLLAGFDREARRKIRNASSIPYKFESSDSPDRLASIWHLYQELAVRKGFFHRPLSSYLDLMAGARPFNAVRVYVVSLNGQPVNSLFLINDSQTAFYMSGALNVQALQGNPTPAPMLVSKAMQNAAQAGLKFFHFGTKSGKVYRFKSQFCPVERQLPPPVTVILNRPLYRCWVSGILPLAPKLKAILKRSVADKEERQ